ARRAAVLAPPPERSRRLRLRGGCPRLQGGAGVRSGATRYAARRESGADGVSRSLRRASGGLERIRGLGRGARPREDRRLLGTLRPGTGVEPRRLDVGDRVQRRVGLSARITARRPLV